MTSALEMTNRPQCECHGVEQFWQARPDRRTGGNWSCNVRRKGVDREYRQAHPERVAERARLLRQREPARMKFYQLRTKYGLTREDHERLMLDQGGRCAMCGAESVLVVDHDHDTGVVRGLLCRTCNIGLGWLERPGWRELADRYLGNRS